MGFVLLCLFCYVQVPSYKSTLSSPRAEGGQVPYLFLVSRCHLSRWRTVSNRNSRKRSSTFSVRAMVVEAISSQLDSPNWWEPITATFPYVLCADRSFICSGHVFWLSSGSARSVWWFPHLPFCDRLIRFKDHVCGWSSGCRRNWPHLRGINRHSVLRPLQTEHDTHISRAVPAFWHTAPLL